MRMCVLISWAVLLKTSNQSRYRIIGPCNALCCARYRGCMSQIQLTNVSISSTACTWISVLCCWFLVSETMTFCAGASISLSTFVATSELKKPCSVATRRRNYNESDGDLKRFFIWSTQFITRRKYSFRFRDISLYLTPQTTSWVDI